MSKSKKYAYAKVTVADKTIYHTAQEVAENRSKMNQAEYDKYNPRCTCDGCNARLTTVKNSKGTYFYRQIDSHDTCCWYYNVKKAKTVDRNIRKINYIELAQKLIGDINTDSDIVGKTQLITEDDENTTKPKINLPKPPRGGAKLYEEKKYVMCDPRTINRLFEALYSHLNDDETTEDGYRADQVLINMATAARVTKTKEIAEFVIADIVRGVGRRGFDVFKDKNCVYGICPDIEQKNKKIKYCLYFYDEKARNKFFKKTKRKPRRMRIMAHANVIDENKKAVLIQIDVYNAQQIAIARKRIRNNEVNR